MNRYAPASCNRAVRISTKGNMRLVGASHGEPVEILVVLSANATRTPRMPRSFHDPTLIAALDALQGWTDQGFTFLDHRQPEQFFSFDGLRAEAMKRAAHFRH